MKLALLILLLFTRYDQYKFDPDGKFEVGRYYKHPYSVIIYIRERAILHDGSNVLVVESVKGKYCIESKVCAIPANTRKDAWVEVERID